MQVSVTFRHMEADERVKDHVEEKVRRLQKYIENQREMHVVLSAEKFRHSAELIIVGDGITLNSQGKDRDLYTAIDQMIEKMDRQIRERRGKVKRKRGNPIPLEMTFREEENNVEGSEETETPPLVRKRRILAKPMTLDEAVAQLKISKEDFLFFINSDSGQMNLLYRRDGGYDWMEPSPK